MCSSGGKIAATDEALQAAQAKAADTYTKDAAITFAEQQSVLGQQTARMNYIAANPMGYTPTQLHTATTAINDNTARAAKQALGSAAAFAASHGSSDIGGGAIGQVAGEIGSEAAQSKAGQLAALSTQNEELKQKNFWNAISGLNSVGSELGGSTGTSIGGETGSASSAVNAGSGALAAKQAGWQNLSGALTGIGGIAAGLTGTGGLSGLIHPSASGK